MSISGYDNSLRYLWRKLLRIEPVKNSVGYYNAKTTKETFYFTQQNRFHFFTQNLIMVIAASRY